MPLRWLYTRLVSAEEPHGDRLPFKLRAQVRPFHSSFWTRPSPSRASDSRASMAGPIARRDAAAGAGPGGQHAGSDARCARRRFARLKRLGARGTIRRCKRGSVGARPGLPLRGGNQSQPARPGVSGAHATIEVEKSTGAGPGVRPEPNRVRTVLRPMQRLEGEPHDRSKLLNWG
jgi:hypothetical protein